MVIAHSGVYVTDYKRARAFYDKVLPTLGYTQNMEYGENAGYNDGKNTDMWVAKRDTIIPMHIALEAKSAAEVDEFYKAALAAGGTDNGAPGYRTDYWPGYYACFVHDPDGHNIEAVWYDYSKVEEK